MAALTIATGGAALAVAGVLMEGGIVSTALGAGVAVAAGVGMGIGLEGAAMEGNVAEATVEEGSNEISNGEEGKDEQGYNRIRDGEFGGDEDAYQKYQDQTMGLWETGVMINMTAATVGSELLPAAGFADMYLSSKFPNVLSEDENIIPDEFYKLNGGMEKDDCITNHAEKHLYNPDAVSTMKKTQFGKDVDLLKLREDTMLHPDSIVYNDEHNVIKYIKEYDFNISTEDTPTGKHRVFINLDPKPGKTNRNSQFPLYEGDK